MKDPIKILSVAMTDGKGRSGFCLSVVQKGILLEQVHGPAEEIEEMPGFLGAKVSSKYSTTKAQLDALGQAILFAIDNYGGAKQDIMVYAANEYIIQIINKRVAKYDKSLSETIDNLHELLAKAYRKFQDQTSLHIVMLPKTEMGRNSAQVSFNKGGLTTLLDQMTTLATIGMNIPFVQPTNALVQTSNCIQSDEDRKRSYYSEKQFLLRIQDAFGASANNVVKVMIWEFADDGDMSSAVEMAEDLLTVTSLVDITNFIKTRTYLSIMLNKETTPVQWRNDTTGCGVCFLFSMFQIKVMSAECESEPSSVPFDDENRRLFAQWLERDVLPKLQNKCTTLGTSAEREYRVRLVTNTISFIRAYKLGDQLPNSSHTPWADRGILDEVMSEIDMSGAKFQFLERISEANQRVVFDSEVNELKGFYTSKYSFTEGCDMMKEGNYRQMYADNHYFLTTMDKSRVLEFRQAVNKLCKVIQRLVNEMNAGRNHLASNQLVLELANQGSDQGSVNANVEEIVIEDVEEEDDDRDEMAATPATVTPPAKVWSPQDFQHCKPSTNKTIKKKPIGPITHIECCCGRDLTLSTWRSDKLRNNHFEAKPHRDYVEEEMARRNDIEEPINEDANDEDLILGYQPDTPLINVDIDDLPSILIMMASPVTLPDNLIKLSRIAYTKLLDEVVKNHGDIQASLKVFLFAAVLTTPKKDVTRREGMRLILDYIIKDRWDLITLRHFHFKPIRTEPQLITTQDHQVGNESDDKVADPVTNAALRLLKVGEVGKALKLLTRTDPLPPGDERTVQQMKDKHPEPNLDVGIEEDLLKRLQGFKPTKDMQMSVTLDRLRKILLSGRRCLRGGPDKGSFELYAALIGYGAADKPDENEFGEVLAKYFELILNVKLPPEIMKLIRDIELLALAKGDQDIRPIGLNSFLRKIATILFMDEAHKSTTEGEQWLEKYFGDLQMQGAQNGTEKIVHLMRELHIRHPDLCIAAMDGDNAFNRGSRLHGLVNLLQSNPRLVPFAAAMYGADMPTNGHLLTNLPDDRVAIIGLKEGCVQGDVMATFFYGMIIQPFLKKISELLDGSETTTPQVVRAFVDDTNCAANFDNLVQVLEFVIQEGPKYGYHIKFAKGSYLIGKCDSLETAVAQVQTLVDMGFDKEIIHIHPDNYDSGVLSADEFAQVCTDYGVKMLGCFIGHPMYVQKMMNGKITQLTEVAEILCNFPDNQGKNLMLRWCFTNMVNFWLRTHDTEESLQLVDAFTLLQKQVLCSMLNPPSWHIYQAQDMDERLWCQCQLNINQGGLGLTNQYLVRYAAYSASFTEALVYIQRVLPTIIDDADDNTSELLRPYKIAILQLQSDTPNLNPEKVRMILLDIVQPHGEDEETKSLQNVLSIPFKANMLTQFFISIEDDPAWTVWHKSLVNSSAGAWISQAPKNPNLKIGSRHFTVALLLRTYQRMPFYPPGSTCDCKGSPAVDMYGKFILSGCNCGGFRSENHDNLCHQLYSMYRCCGHYAIREARGQFVSDNNKHINKRPDITVINGSADGDKLHIDARISYPKQKLNRCVLPNNIPSQTELSEFESDAMQAAQGEKFNKYNRISNESGAEFSTFIIGTPGNLSKAAVDTIFNATEHYASVNAIKHPLLIKYWITRISISHQRSIANAILHRSIAINGKRSRSNDPSPEAIKWHDIIDNVHRPISFARHITTNDRCFLNSHSESDGDASDTVSDT